MKISIIDENTYTIVLDVISKQMEKYSPTCTIDASVEKKFNFLPLPY